MLATKPECFNVVESDNKSFVNMVELNLNLGFQIQETFFPSLCFALISIVVQIYRGLEFICESDCIYCSFLCWQSINTFFCRQYLDAHHCCRGARQLSGAGKEEASRGLNCPSPWHLSRVKGTSNIFYPPSKYINK